MSVFIPDQSSNARGVPEGTPKKNVSAEPLLPAVFWVSPYRSLPRS
jgi:hypothetical protein